MCVLAYVHICVYVYVCIHICVYACIYMCVYMHVCIYMTSSYYSILFFKFYSNWKINAYCNNLNNRKATNLSLLIHTPPFLFPPFQCNQILNNLKLKINLLWIFSIMFFGIHTQISTWAYSTGHILNFLFFSVSLSNIMWTSFWSQ